MQALKHPSAQTCLFAHIHTWQLFTQNRGPEGRFATLQTVAEMDKWTASAPRSTTIPLTVHWHTLRLRPKCFSLPVHYTEVFGEEGGHGTAVAAATELAPGPLVEEVGIDGGLLLSSEEEEDEELVAVANAA